MASGLSDDVVDYVAGLSDDEPESTILCDDASVAELVPGFVMAPRTASMAALRDGDEPKFVAFGKALLAATAQAQAEILDGTCERWPTTPKILEWMKKRGHWTESMRIGYAIEERVYQLMGWKGGPKQGEWRGLEWSGQGCASLSKGTLPDFAVTLGPGREALFDISSNLLFRTTQKLHIEDKSPPWTGSKGVAYAAEIHYDAFSAETLQALATHGAISQEAAAALSQKMAEDQAKAYAGWVDRRRAIKAVVNYLYGYERPEDKNAFQVFRDAFFDGSIMGNATTEANNFLRVNNIKDVTAQPSTTAKASATMKVRLNERFDTVLADRYSEKMHLIEDCDVTRS